jgi:hypothetical protein
VSTIFPAWPVYPAKFAMTPLCLAPMSPMGNFQHDFLASWSHVCRSSPLPFPPGYQLLARLPMKYALSRHVSDHTFWTMRQSFRRPPHHEQWSGDSPLLIMITVPLPLVLLNILD